jgi:hypothetical protein
MVFNAEIEIFDRNVLQASYKNAKCLVSGTETGFFSHEKANQKQERHF